jgi:hypothetical protein
MHFNLKRAVGVMAIPLLGSALAVGATALPAHAQTWQDTALSASAVTLTPFGGSVLGAADGTSTDIVLAGTGVTWSLHTPLAFGVTLTDGTITYSGPGAASTVIVVDATDNAGNVEVLLIPVTLASDAIQTGSPPFSTANLSTLADTTTNGTVTFSTASLDGISFVESSLPAGLVGGPTLTYVGGTAAAGTHAVDVTATDPTNGAVQKGTFSLTVYASDVYTVGSGGDEVNPFGIGFDVYRQHRYAGAIIVGWTATRADPATHFFILSGTYYSGAVKFEYAPDGAGTGLCVTDPGGGWKSDPLPDGLILTKCDDGPWQQFVPESNGTLRDVATGLVVKPSTTAGVQLRGATAPVSWGGSVYGWTNFANLPA